MTHPTEGELHAWLDGEGPAEVGRHLETCGECRLRLEEARSLHEHVRRILGEAEPGPGPVPSLETLRAKAAGLGSPTGGRRPYRLRPPLAWAASVVLALAAGWIGRQLTYAPTAPPPAARPEPTVSGSGERARIPGAPARQEAAADVAAAEVRAPADEAAAGETRGAPPALEADALREVPGPEAAAARTEAAPAEPEALAVRRTVVAPGGGCYRLWYAAGAPPRLPAWLRLTGPEGAADARAGPAEAEPGVAGARWRPVPPDSVVVSGGDPSGLELRLEIGAEGARGTVRFTGETGRSAAAVRGERVACPGMAEEGMEPGLEATPAAAAPRR